MCSLWNGDITFLWHSSHTLLTKGLTEPLQPKRERKQSKSLYIFYGIFCQRCTFSETPVTEHMIPSCPSNEDMIYAQCISYIVCTVQCKLSSHPFFFENGEAENQNKKFISFFHFSFSLIRKFGKKMWRIATITNVPEKVSILVRDDKVCKVT